MKIYEKKKVVPERLVEKQQDKIGNFGGIEAGDL